MMERPSWDEYFMGICNVVAQRSTCTRKKVGAVIVKDKRILATGYNGAPTGLPHCADVGCQREKLGIPSGERVELCRGLHAEQNAICQAATHGISIKAATVYITLQPCVACSKMMINSSVRKIVYNESYADSFGVKLLEEAGVEIVKFKEE